MKIIEVEPIHLRLKGGFFEKIETMVKADSVEDVLLIKIVTDEGINGYGEAYSASNIIEAIINAPIYHTEFSRGFKEILVGQDPFDIEVLWDKMYKASLFYGRRGAAISAISGINIALWDTIGQATRQPIHKLLGGSYRNKIKVYASTKMPLVQEEAIELAKKIKNMGFKAIKFGYRPMKISLLEAVKNVLGDEILLMVDAGPHMDTEAAINYAKECEELNIYWLEEPLLPDNVGGYIRLIQSLSRLKIATGENESTRWGFRELIDKVKPHIIQPDLARAGGFSEAIKISQIASEKGIRCIPHVWGSSLMFIATMHFIAAIPHDSLLEYWGLGGSPFVKDLINPSAFKLTDGFIDVPTSPGLGVIINEEVIEKYRVG